MGPLVSPEIKQRTGIVRELSWGLRPAIFCDGRGLASLPEGPTRLGRIRPRRQESELSNEKQKEKQNEKQGVQIPQGVQGPQGAVAGTPGGAEDDATFAVGVLAEAARLTVAEERRAGLAARRGRLLGAGRALEALDLDGQRLQPAFRLEWK